MNAYFIDGGEVHDPMAGAERVVDVVIAQTRNRAKYLFWLKYKGDLGDFIRDKWCEKIRLIQQNVDLPEGVLTDVASGVGYPKNEEAYRLLWDRAVEVCPPHA